MAINLGTIFAQIGLDTTLLRAGVSKANAQIVKADRSIGGFVKRNEKRFIGFGAAGVAAVGAIAIASVKMAGDFDQAMRNVNTITRVSEDQFREMKEEVIDLSKEVPFTAKELSNGLFQVASAGVDAAEQMNFLKISAQAATAGQAEMASTVKGLTGVLKAYGLGFNEVERISDLFFKTNELGVTTFQELADSMGAVVPLAAALGVSTEELFGSMAALTGVTGNTSQVVTQLRGVFVALTKPSSEAKKLADELGISFDANSIKTLGLTGFLEQLREKTGGNVETMGTLFGRVEALNGIMALSGPQFDDFITKLDAMENSAGAMTDAFSEQQKGLNNQLKILRNNIAGIALDIGGKIIPQLTDFTKNVNELDDSTKDTIATTAQWGLATIGAASAASLLLVGGRKLLGFMGPWGRAIAVIVAATTTHFKVTQKLSDLIENEWLSNILSSISLIGSFTEAIKVWNRATEIAETENMSLIKVLFSRRSLLSDTTGETEELTAATERQLVSLQEEKLAMQKSAEGLRIRTLAQEEATEATEEDIETLGDLVDSLFRTFLLNADLTESLENSKQAFLDLAEAEKEFGIGSEEANEALVNLALALDAAAVKLPDIINKVGALTEEELAFLQATRDNITAAEEFGIVEKSVWDGVAAVINDRIENQIRVDFQKMLQDMSNINLTEVNPVIKANTTEAEKSLNNVIGLMARIRSKTVTINTIITSNRRPGALGGFEKGGLIRGFANGGTTSDRTVMVGERGPELATLPLRTRISPNNQLGQALGGESGGEIVIPVTVNLDSEVLFQSNERIENKEDFRRIT